MGTYYAVLFGKVRAITMDDAEVEEMRADPDKEKLVAVPGYPLQPETLYGDTIYDSELDALMHWRDELNARITQLRAWLVQTEDDCARASREINRIRRTPTT